MKQYWNNLSSREQLILLAGGVFILAILYFFILIDPALQSTKNATQQIHQQAVSLAWMQSTAQEVKQLENNAAPTDRSQSILVTVDRAARRLQLKPALKRLEPEGNNRVRLWFENAAFESIIQFFAQLQQQNGIQVQSISLNRLEQSGYVDAKIVLSNEIIAP